VAEQVRGGNGVATTLTASPHDRFRVKWVPNAMPHDFEVLARAILSGASDAIIAADRDGVITLWNPGAERIFGHPADEAVGQSLDIIIPERLRPAHWRGFSEVMETGQSRYGTGDLLSVPSVRRDGERISIEFTIVPLKDPEGRMTGMVATLRDVTARFEELKTLRRRLAALEPS
jgi:PAS domain S-box-containing protein